MQEPSQIDKNCAQERSVIDPGGRSPKIVLPEARFVSYFTQLGRFGAPFGSQLGNKELPKSSFLVPSRPEIYKNDVQWRASE